ncbi:MAG: site-specific DNA-methyltransferase [archaeon]|uniref:Type II methyltransferase n=1 Tax=Methanobrevibacter gottschalkii DSM 11977 TaxID=1122229 RepID=A0A3N5B5C7_9EURY|nr:MULTISPECIES: site-specific DNA-methyltransferase [Methanobrevibacter]MCQ2971191.1 site-specific DNA-methyltransferase [archaeon]OEC97556.1 SAM-dependent methyltransferase [Methanobrevibacter sp. A27]RPF52523.1 site-specific DNA-methyltransferase (adenine-specific) [Methanobrevibacter gottschalkii DSM 11977]
MVKKTQTASFGSVLRQSHNSRKFYNSKLYENLKIPENIDFKEFKIKKEDLNKLYCKSSENMDEIPDNSIHLMITSPPYNVGKEYDDDLTLDEYLELLTSVFAQTYKKLVSGGRACINIANIGRKPYIPLHAMVIEIMLNLGFLMRGEIIWDKSASAGGSCAWGSWMSASNPVLRDFHEYILIFSKESYSKNKSQEKKDTISHDEFIQWTKSIWTFPAVNAKKIGHPAPFPTELPHRLINLYSYEGDVVLDPFCGSGTTCIAATKNKRNYIGYDIEEKYIQLSKSRLSNQKFI